MKKLFGIMLFVMMLSIGAQAKIVEMWSKLDTVRGCYNDILHNRSVRLKFGKFLFQEEYGVFAYVSCRVHSGAEYRLRTEKHTIFYRKG